MKRLFVALVVASFFTVATASASAATVVVHPFDMDGWATQTSGTASVSFVNGPGTPPLGNGSARLQVGSDGNSGAQLRNVLYDGTRLADLSTLEYSTYVANNNGSCQAPYIILNVDQNADGSVDDQLFFEPCYQTGAYSGDPVPNQGNVTTGVWQDWDAAAGGWWSLNAGTFGPPLVTLDSYVASHPDAVIRNAANGAGGVRLVAGFGAPAWDNFDGNVDAFTIANGSSTTYDFEPDVGPPTNKDQCKKDGWKAFNAPPFKNQGDCVSYVNKQS